LRFVFFRGLRSTGGYSPPPIPFPCNIALSNATSAMIRGPLAPEPRMSRTPDRRSFLAASAAGLTALSLPVARGESPPVIPVPPLTPPSSLVPRLAASKARFSLNTSTINWKLPLMDLIRAAAKLGYDAVEPWLGREIEGYVKSGGSLADAAKLASDSGVEIIDAIGFANWIVDDDAKRREGLEQAKRDMDRLRTLGCTRIAAPPAGATNQALTDPRRIAERFAALAEVGRSIGVQPQLEVWGFSKTLSRLSETAMVAVEAGAAQAGVLADVYHLFKGGSDFGGLRYLSAGALQVFHVNDYPAGLKPAEAKDEHRVFPGDGAAPLASVFASLAELGFRGCLSLELFNREYWKRDPLEVAAEGLRKMKAAAAALA
jgi:sugar phosphate isomerase/epimerase